MPTHTEPAQAAVPIFLSLLDELEGEIELAQQAMVEGRLPAFESSLREQLTLCGRLSKLYPHLSMHSEPSTQLRLQQACTRALHANRSYATLVQQAQGTTTVLLALCAGYRIDQENVGRRSMFGEEGPLCTA